MPSTLKYEIRPQTLIDKARNIVRIAPESGVGPRFRTDPRSAAAVLAYINKAQNFSAFNSALAESKVSGWTYNIIFATKRNETAGTYSPPNGFLSDPTISIDISSGKRFENLTGANSNLYVVRTFETLGACF